MKRFAFMIVAAFLGGMISIGIYSQITRGDQNQEVYQANTPGSFEALPAGYSAPSVVPEGIPNFIDAADMTVHSVVHIKTEVRRRSSVYDEFFNEFFGRPQPQYNQPLVATGSGVILTHDGYIVTNNHVVHNAERLEVTLNDKRTYEAEIVGTDPSTDLALIKINENGLPSIKYGNSDNVRVGEWVLAVGNPFNLTSTVTAGIVSAKARDINILGVNSAIESFIQTDAPVNPGNSGGALVNTDGELIGINAAIASNTGSYTGYSFAIPVNLVKKVVNDFINYGEIQRAYIGVTIRDIDNKFAEEMELEDLQGVYVVSVVENSSAADADIRAEDIILGIDGIQVNSTSRLLETVGQHNPGDKIEVTIRRNGDLKKKEVLLKNRQNNFDVLSHDEMKLIDKLGATFQEVSTEEKLALGIDYGMKIVELRRGKLMDKGIREGFIITEIDKKPIRSADDINNLLLDKRGGVLIEGVYPNGQRNYYAIGM
ncbi:MAG: Do family serine endopeptidase [Bacteroidales bacterium]|nr:Do family serine endopeptidase [Bacteroidales bacterium]